MCAVRFGFEFRYERGQKQLSSKESRAFPFLFFVFFWML